MRQDISGGDRRAGLFAGGERGAEREEESAPDESGRGRRRTGGEIDFGHQWKGNTPAPPRRARSGSAPGKHDLADLRLHRGAVRLLLPVVVVRLPTGVGDEVENTPNQRAVRWFSQAGSVRLQNLLLRQAGRKEHHALGLDTVLHGQKRIAVAIETVDAAE